MSFIKRIVAKRALKRKIKNELCDSFIKQIDIAIKDIDNLFLDEQNFLELNKEVEWKNKNWALIMSLEQKNIKELKKTTNYKRLLNNIEILKNNIETLKKQIIIHNNKVAKNKIENAYELIGDVEGVKLDEQQMTCIVKEFYNHLVIAGAGAGKTTTIIGKIKFLLKSKKCNPEDILVLSFTNASAKEMKERITKETGFNIEASTFHKLGLNIITKVDGVIPIITKIDLYKFISEQLSLNIKNIKYLDMLCSYLLYNRIRFKSEFEFTTSEEYEEYLQSNPPITINNETVKSYGELDIANFLTKNGISYIYEKSYKIDTRTSEYGQYYPDFYLQDYDIYIEYFGIDKNGNVPSYFKSKNGFDAKEEYNKSMEWKRNVHKENETTLVECYAYEKFDGILLENLRKKLIECKVELKPKPTKELWKQISNENNHMLDGIIELFETIINLMKSNNYTISMLRELNAIGSDFQSNDLIISLIEPIYNAYNSKLNSNNEIDFNDMINIANEYVIEEKFVSNYKYVIVDEYQDISKTRFLLLNNMRKSNNYNLFCVGDDWQSIYRFAGSDIGYILNFERYWGLSEISKIETTYRFSQSLINISSNFIMQNPCQIKKNIRGNNNINSFPLGEINGFNDEFAITFMLKKFDDLPINSSVFLIGRYSFDIKLLDNNIFIKYYYNNINKMIDVKYNNRPDLKISFLTVHKSKGLQADYVFIINNKNSKVGFPSKIQDAPILELLLDNYDNFPYSEERRLFYVALTRAKKKVFIVTVKNQESMFALELKNDYQSEIKRERYECPKCGGKLYKKKGKYGEFIGCSNYSVTGCDYKRKIG